MPDITVEEVKAAVTEMKNRKSPGEDGVSIKAIKLGGDTLVSAITALFNKCLESEKIPKAWENAVISERQGDTISPTLFTSTLESVFKKIPESSTFRR